jgi:hypothetical protein
MTWSRQGGKKMRLVILESPFRGSDPEATEANKRYAKLAMLDSLRRGESPLASHLLWPGILDDSDATERAIGIEAGLAWGRVAEATVVYRDRGISDGHDSRDPAGAARKAALVEQRRLYGVPKEKGAAT